MGQWLNEMGKGEMVELPRDSEQVARRLVGH